MNPFMFHNPVRVYFGEGAAKHGLEAELPQVGSRILLAYGGGSIKRNGVYDEIVSRLRSAAAFCWLTAVDPSNATVYMTRSSAC